jgi:predicted nucleic-acid-binding protein
MAQAENGEVTLFITSMVLAEVIWVLKSFYRYPMTDIATTILAFLSAEGIETEERDLIIQAIELSRDRNVDFIDAYIAVQAARHGEKICTFDATHFKRLPVVWLSPE